MNITIITDDSKVKLPQIDLYRNRVGRGIDIYEYEPLIKTLRDRGLELPTDDLEIENVYRSALWEFIRPAKLMFSGMFGEVRKFSEELAIRHTVDLRIISGRYGVVSGDEEIIPYNVHLERMDSIAELDRRTDFVSRLFSGIRDSDYVILLVNREMMSYLLSKNVLARIGTGTRVIAVTSYDFQKILESEGHIFFHRRGVARIGKKNREKIIEMLEGT